MARPAASATFISTLLAIIPVACSDDAPAEAGDEAGESGEPEPPMGLLEATQVVTGVTQVCAEALDGRVVCWGDNERGQVGDGTLEFRRYPVVTGLTGVAEIEAAWRQVCARMDDGTLQCWGEGDFGQLGSGVAEHGHHQNTPTPVFGFDEVVDVSLTGTYGCAVRADGTVWCWGLNSPNGTLGFDSELCGPFIGMRDDEFEYDEPCAKTPTQVPGIDDAVEVAAGGAHQCARHQDGTVSCWGASNQHGMLGDGSPNPPISIEPRPVIGLADVVQLEAGWSFTCALVSDGSVWCWGSNTFGELGQGLPSSELSHLPTATQVPGLSGVARLSAKNSSVCAVTDAGAVSCWGDAIYLFENGYSSYDAPVPVEFGAAAVDVDSNGFTTCILDVDGHVRCLGTTPGNGSTAWGDWSGDPVLWDG